MLHAVRISGGRASYSNSYVRTTRLAKERAAGRSMFSKVCCGASFAACIDTLPEHCCAAPSQTSARICQCLTTICPATYHSQCR